MIITLLCCWKLKLNFALGAILALIHDVIVTLGLLTLLGVEIDLNVIAALLTLVATPSTTPSSCTTASVKTCAPCPQTPIRSPPWGRSSTSP